MPTPGGNSVAHTDPYIEKYGTALFRGARPSDDVALDHVLRWKFLKGYVALEIRSGFYLFNEKTRSLGEIGNEKELTRAIKSMGATALSRWIYPQDGWESNWYVPTTLKWQFVDGRKVGQMVSGKYFLLQANGRVSQFDSEEILREQVRQETGKSFGQNWMNSKNWLAPNQESSTVHP